MKVYSIRCKNNDFVIQIGSTTQKLNRNKRDCKLKTSHLYNFIKKNGGIDNFYMELIEEFKGTKDELRKREGEVIREYKKNPEYYVLNHRIECRTRQEHYQDNRERIIQKQIEYNNNNRERKHVNDKNYYDRNRECILAQKREIYKMLKEN